MPAVKVVSKLRKSKLTNSDATLSRFDQLKSDSNFGEVVAH